MNYECVYYYGNFMGFLAIIGGYFNFDKGFIYMCLVNSTIWAVAFEALSKIKK